MSTNNPVKQHSGHKRVANDWYVEPWWTVKALTDRVGFDGDILDPCCGGGNIVKELRAIGYPCWAGDIEERGFERQFFGDFLAEPGWIKSYEASLVVSVFPPKINHIVTNPPYAIAQKIVERGLATVPGKVCVLVRLSFLASQGRNSLFRSRRVSRVIILSNRPSMPPGGTDIPAKGGMHDFCWIVFDNEGGGPARIEWAL